MPPQIYDKDGNLRTLFWLTQKYGNVQFLDAGAGTKFRLMRIDETEGPAVLKARVLDLQGNPLAGQPVANHWPSPTLPLLTGGNLQTLWQDQAIYQNTDNAGFTGFGLGTGSYIGNLIEGGPHTVWVLSPTLPSDGVSGLGMLGGTNHMGPLFLTFQISNSQPAPNPDPQPEPGTPDDLGRLLALCVPMMTSTWTPAEIVSRAWSVLDLAKTRVA